MKKGVVVLQEVSTECCVLTKTALTVAQISCSSPSTWQGGTGCHLNVATKPGAPHFILGIAWSEQGILRRMDQIHESQSNKSAPKARWCLRGKRLCLSLQHPLPPTAHAGRPSLFSSYQIQFRKRQVLHQTLTLKGLVNTSILYLWGTTPPLWEEKPGAG